MTAPKGNKFWKARSSHGRYPIFADAEQLWVAAEQYFDWVEENPLYEIKLVTFQGKATQEPLAKMRAMTIAGLCIFLDICEKTWFNYAHHDDFLHVTTRIDRIIRTQKFEGACADLLNAKIIARDLGLADKKEIGGSGGAPMPVSTISIVSPEMDENGRAL